MTNNASNIAFGQRLKMILDFYQLKQVDLVARTGLSQTNISHLITGRREPTLKTLAKVIYALPDCDLGWLICGDVWWSGTKRATDSELLLFLRKMEDQKRAGKKLRP